MTKHNQTKIFIHFDLPLKTKMLTCWFVSHVQRRGGDVAHLIALLGPHLHSKQGWFDMFIETDLNAECMQDGVKNTEVFVLFLTRPYSSSWFCLLELATALFYNKPLVLLLEADSNKESVTDLNETFREIESNLNCYLGLSGEGKNGFNSFSNYLEKPNLEYENIQSKFIKTIRYNHSNPLLSIRQIIPRNSNFDLHFKDNVQVLITCNLQEGICQSWVLLMMCLEKNIKAKIIQQELDYSSELPLIVFCTEHLMQDKLVQFVLNKHHNNKKAFVHEADGRRLGSLQEGKADEFWKDFNFDYSTSIAFTKSTRNILYSNVFIIKVLNQIGLIKPTFNAKQTELIHNGIEVSNEVKEWLLSLNSAGLFTKEVMNIQNASAIVDCSLLNDIDIIKSLSYQLYVNIPGFYQGFKQEVKSEDLDELLEYYLVNPLQQVNIFVFNGKSKWINILV
jgi:hypothetical protein